VVAAAVAEPLGYGWLQPSQPTGFRPSWQQKPATVHVYRAERTPSFFHLADDKVRGLMGPRGSGKSTACCAEIMMRAVRQPVDSSGARRSKWVVVRNTYRELMDTTVATWLDWIPEEKTGRFSRSDTTHHVRQRLEDGTRLELDVMFRALDRPADVKKLLSLECTAAYVNEAKEIPTRSSTCCSCR
jgi:Phage terminase large subunit